MNMDIILLNKTILGKMGGWNYVLPSCPECEKEDQGLILGSAGSKQGEGVVLLVVKQKQPQASVESKREGWKMGGNNDDKSSSSLPVDSDSLSKDELSSALQSYEGDMIRWYKRKYMTRGGTLILSQAILRINGW
jgi:hypothetical protein